MIHGTSTKLTPPPVGQLGLIAHARLTQRLSDSLHTQVTQIAGCAFRRLDRGQVRRVQRDFRGVQRR